MAASLRQLLGEQRKCMDGRPGRYSAPEESSRRGGQQGKAPQRTTAPLLIWAGKPVSLCTTHAWASAAERSTIPGPEQHERDMTPAQRKWLATALATRPGQPHKDLGRYRRQTVGCASGVSEDRPCPLCGKPPPRRGHDPCLANLPGVNNACCGHGMYTPYATLTSGFCLRGEALETYLRRVGRLQRFRKMSGLRYG